MITAYFVVLCILLFIMHFLSIRIRNKKNISVKPLRHLIWSVSLVAISSMLTMLIPVENIAMFFHCVHYAGIVWMLILLLIFAETYSFAFWNTKTTRGIIYFLAALYTISTMLNVKFHHMGTCAYTAVNRREMCYIFTPVQPGFSIHLSLICLLCLFNYLVFFTQIFKSTLFFRKKYVTIVILFTLAIVLNCLNYFSHLTLNFSPLIYIVMAIFFVYFSIYYTPKDLITKTLTYVIGDLHSGVVCFDAKGYCIYANEEALWLYSDAESLTDMEMIFRQEVHNQNFAQAAEFRQIKQFARGGQVYNYEMIFNKLYDKQDQYIGCFFTFYDKTEDFNKLQKERYRATHDSLTGLYNRQFFYEQASALVKAATDEKYYIICSNIKDFKLINDLFGIEKGNEILTRFGMVLEKELQNSAVYGRLESDRFAICMSENRFSEAIILKLMHQIIAPIQSNQYKIHIHIGVYEVTNPEEEIATMCDRANMAVNMIKEDKQYAIAYYDHKMMEQVIQEKKLISEFDTALAEKQFCMYLQPQVATNGTVLGAEALVRWIHPERGLIPPGEFISVFERNGLIYRMDQDIWECAASLLQKWKNMGADHLHISVNISAKDFYYLDIYKIFTELVEKYEISPSRLKLELTETALMMDLDKQLTLIDQLQKYGFQVEIDDFGSGYSSLNMLKDIKADVLKIDMGFLQKTVNHSRSEIILNSIIQLAKQLEMEVISEGVEYEIQVEYLTQAGCDMFQGFYFARPIPVEEFEKKYLGNRQF